MAEEKVWRPLDLAKVTAGYLAAKGVPDARFDAETLLVEAMSLKRRVDLYAGFELEVTERALATYREFVRRRAAREPVSRILGVRGFMGLAFTVTPDVLSPRPETELLVEAALDALRPGPRPGDAPADPGPAGGTGAGTPPGMSEEMNRILDSYAEDVDDEADIDAEPVPIPAARPAPRRAAAARPAAPAGPVRRIRALDLGTGSGCIATALATLLPGVSVLAVDSCPAALAVARGNAGRAGAADRIEFRLGDWFAACREGECFDIVLSNPPYLIEGDPDIWPEVSRYDPPRSLYGGPDGLECYRRIIPDAPSRMPEGGLIFLEVGAGQADKVMAMLEKAGFGDVAALRDHGGTARAIRGVRRASPAAI